MQLGSGKAGEAGVHRAKYQKEERCTERSGDPKQGPLHSSAEYELTGFCE